MAFPSTPTNGQRTVVNGTTYQYSTGTQAWTRIVGVESSTSTSFLSVAITGTTTSTSVSTGSLIIDSGVGITSNLYLGSNINTPKIIVGGGIRRTTASSAPSNPTVGDLWYWTGVDALLQYINDGTSSYWVDITGRTI